MKAARAETLINRIIDSVIEKYGAENAIGYLLNVGFTAEELVQDAQFLQKDVDAEVTKRKEQTNG